MQRKQVFPPEPDTQPDIRRAKAITHRKNAAGPRKSDDRSERPTEPPPAKKARPSTPPRKDGDRLSGLRSRREANTNPAATVDEVVADMSRDPRRERDGND